MHGFVCSFTFPSTFLLHLATEESHTMVAKQLHANINGSAKLVRQGLKSTGKGGMDLMLRSHDKYVLHELVTQQSRQS